VHLVRNPYAPPWVRYVLMIYDDQHRAAVTMGRRTADAVLDALRPDVEVELSTARFFSWGPADLPLLQYRWITRRRSRDR
jgi:hypothetical protein